MRPTTTAVPVVLMALTLAACSGTEDVGGEAEAGGAESVAPSADPAEQASSAAADRSYDPGALCDRLDTEAIAALAGGQVDATNSTDRSIMDSPSGHCQVMMPGNRTVDIQVWTDAEDRFLSRPESERTPLLETDRVRPIEGVGDRAGAIWATADFDNPANNVRAVAVDYGGMAVNVSARNLDLVREPDLFVAIAERVRADLGL